MECVYQFGDIEVTLTCDVDTMSNFVSTHLERLRDFDIDNRVTYGVYLEQWYTNRGFPINVSPDDRCGRFDRLLLRVMLWSIRWRWNHDVGYATQWLREHMEV